jgi:hypothetical protein
MSVSTPLSETNSRFRSCSFICRCTFSLERELPNSARTEGCSLIIGGCFRLFLDPNRRADHHFRCADDTCPRFWVSLRPNCHVAHGFEPDTTVARAEEMIVASELKQTSLSLDRNAKITRRSRRLCKIRRDRRTGICPAHGAVFHYRRGRGQGTLTMGSGETKLR